MAKISFLQAGGLFYILMFLKLHSPNHYINLSFNLKQPNICILINMTVSPHYGVHMFQSTTLWIELVPAVKCLGKDESDIQFANIRTGFVNCHLRICHSYNPVFEEQIFQPISIHS